MFRDLSELPRNALVHGAALNFLLLIFLAVWAAFTAVNFISWRAARRRALTLFAGVPRQLEATPVMQPLALKYHILTFAEEILTLAETWRQKGFPDFADTITQPVFDLQNALVKEFAAIEETHGVSPMKCPHGVPPVTSEHAVAIRNEFQVRAGAILEHELPAGRDRIMSAPKEWMAICELRGLAYLIRKGVPRLRHWAWRARRLIGLA
jgi:hypothetical protein